MNLTEITKDFGTKYRLAKRYGEQTTEAQKRFFKAVTERLESRTRPQKTIELDTKTTEAEAQEYIKIYHPGWRFVSLRDGIALLEEDPALMKDTYVNTEDGYVYGRTFTQAGPSLDDEWLKRADPALWRAITRWPEPWYSIVRDAINDPDRVDKIFSDYSVERVMCDLSELTDAQIEAMQEYMVPGKISVRLVAPRLAKEEELES